MLSWQRQRLEPVETSLKQVWKIIWMLRGTHTLNSQRPLLFSSSSSLLSNDFEAKLSSYLKDCVKVDQGLRQTFVIIFVLPKCPPSLNIVIFTADIWSPICWQDMDWRQNWTPAYSILSFSARTEEEVYWGLLRHCHFILASAWQSIIVVNCYTVLVPVMCGLLGVYF